MAERSEYEEQMLVLFMDRYNREVATRNCEAMCWDELPLPIRESMAGALNVVVDRVETDMY